MIVSQHARNANTAQDTEADLVEADRGLTPTLRDY